MKQIMYGVLLTMFLIGCSQNRVEVSDIDHSLVAQEKSYIYDIKMQDIAQDLQVKQSPLEQFPFIHNKQTHMKGHFSPEFYAAHNFSLQAKRMDRVDFWKLHKNPKSLDIIYTKDILLENYKEISDDIFTNLCFAHGLSKQEQDILLQWLDNGGVLWVEGSLYSIEPIESLQRFKAKKFLGKDVHFIQLDQNMKDFVYYTTCNDPYFKAIRVLEVYPKQYSQVCTIIDGRTLVATLDQTVVSLSKYGKGMIISLLPFEYEKLYRDGELLRWKLLTLIHDPKELQKAQEVQQLQPVQPSYATQPEKTIQSVETIQQEVIPQEEELNTTATPVVQTQQEEVLEHGNCIQLYTAFNYKKAKKYFVAAQQFPLARIEKRGRAYTARVGMYARVKDAKETLFKLKKYYPSAFIRRCNYKQQ